MDIRPADIDDVPAIDEVLRAVLPWHTAGLDAQRLWFRTAPPAARQLRLVAVSAGRVIGYVSGGLEVHAVEPGIGTLALSVHPDATRQGVGAALHERLDAHLREIGATRIQAYAIDGPAVDWAERRGYTLGASEQYLTLDPRTLPPQPDTPPGVELRTAAQTGPEPFYEVDNVAFYDEPGDVPHTGTDYPDWLERFWPLVDRDTSVIAYVAGKPAALTVLDVNRSTARAMSIGSCTLAEYRGRGLIKLAKSVSLRLAAEAGVTDTFTGNDATNEPMLAINQWLGYHEIGATRSMLKDMVTGR